MSITLLESYIENVLKENEVNTLSVFDFDMTLYNHDTQDWITDTIKQLKQSINNPKERVVLCTARDNNQNLILNTENLLTSAGLSLNDFDDVYFKSTHRKESTPDYKSNVILDELNANKNIFIVKFWEDRKDTLDKTEKEIKKYNKNIKFFPYLVVI